VGVAERSTLPWPLPILFGPIVAVSVSENKFGGLVVVVDRPETAGSNEWSIYAKEAAACRRMENRSTASGDA